MTVSSSRGVEICLVTSDVAATRAAHLRLLGLAAGDEPTVGNGSLRFSSTSGGDFGGGHRVFFGVEDLDAARRLTRRRGLDPGEPVDVTACADTRPAHSDIDAIDHLVFTAPTRDRALALFGATLGLDFRLDRPIGGDIRQLFFRATDLVVEVVVGADPQPAPHCALWGIAWSAPDIEVTHARLTAAGMPVSEIRIGRKPGTRVFTVREHELATRTVVIGPT